MGDHRATYLNGYKEHVLYYWHLIDSQDIVSKFLNILSKDVAASSDKPAALISEPAKRRKKNDDEEATKKFQKSLMTSIGMVGYNTTCEALRLEQKNYRELRLAVLKETDDDMKAIYQEDMQESKEQIKKLKARLGYLEETLEEEAED